MKLKDYRADYHSFSGKASDVARQLSLAGIAIVWLFKLEKAGAFVVPEKLYLPAMLFVVSLALDLLQYVVSTAVWGAFHRYYEWQGKKDDDDLEAPGYFNWPSLILFWGKLVAVLFAYVSLFEYIYVLLHAL